MANEHKERADDNQEPPTSGPPPISPNPNPGHPDNHPQRDERWFWFTWRWGTLPHWFSGAVAVVALIFSLKAFQVSHSGTRAYLDIQDLPSNFGWVLMPRDTLIKATIKNLGRTPARNVEFRAYWAIDDTLRVLCDTIQIGEGSVPVTIGPDRPIELIAGPSVVRDTLKRKRLFLYGKIIYEDVFGDSQYIYFAFEYIASGHSRFFEYKYGGCNKSS